MILSLFFYLMKKNRQKQVQFLTLKNFLQATTLKEEIVKKTPDQNLNAYFDEWHGWL
ncbi:hypothetical protein KYJ26_11060 [Bacillus sp. MCCB 382]|uniref:hypothetical protein n=1 Tax=Bacillus sp. MCCB 382 TaxID=2860197 RepID=UPI001C57996E|nr:hypothetical protein [Bacillus sp. MCCB 382]